MSIILIIKIVLIIKIETIKKILVAHYISLKKNQPMVIGPKFDLSVLASFSR